MIGSIFLGSNGFPFALSEPAVPNPEQVPSHHELLHLLRHRLRSPLLHGEAPDAQDASGLDAPRLWFE